MTPFPAQPGALRIAVVTETFPPEVNGVAMTWGNLVQGLLQRGHAVQLIRPRQAQEAEHATPAGLDLVLAKGVPIPNYPALRFGLILQARLLRVWRKHRPDVVHVVTEGPLGRSAIAAARKLRLPVTSSFHTNFHQYSQHYGIGLLHQLIESYLRRFHNRTLITLAPTRVMAQSLEARGFRPTGVLSRGVAIEQFTPALRSAALREAWGAGGNDLVVLYVGRLAKEKNVGVVQAAYAAIAARFPSAKLVWVGDGPLRASLQAACPNAHFAGIQTGADLAAHYASADLFLFASLTETYGNVVPEALASGLAVVSYACAAAAQLITPDQNGVLAPPDDEARFIQEALALATDGGRRAELRRQAPASVAHLSWTAVTDGYEATLRAMIERYRSRHAEVRAALPESVNQAGLPSA